MPKHLGGTADKDPSAISPLSRRGYCRLAVDAGRPPATPSGSPI